MAHRNLVNGDDFNPESLRGQPSNIGEPERSHVPTLIVVCMIVGGIIAALFAV